MQAIDVPYLADEAIEQRAEALLDDFCAARYLVLRPPILVEEILMYLGLSLDLDDLEKMLGITGVESALWFDSREMFIDESLDPERTPAMEGHFYFSICIFLRRSRTRSPQSLRRWARTPIDYSRWRDVSRRMYRPLSTNGPSSLRYCALLVPCLPVNSGGS